MCVLLVSSVLTGCRGGEAEGDLDIELSWSMSDEIPTVALLEGSFGQSVDEAWVDYGQTGVYTMTAPIDGETDFELPLLGMKAGSEYHFRVTASVDGELYHGEDNVIETPDGVPEGLPTLDVTAGTSSGVFLAMSMLTFETGLVAILDPDGEFVWWWNGGWKDAYLPRVYLSPDGESLTYMLVSEHVGGDTEIGRVRLDGTSSEVVGLVETGHHDFVELPDGTVAVIRYDLQSFKGLEVVGDKVVEIAPDGTESDAFSCWDFLEYDPAHQGHTSDSYTHFNAIDYIPEEDAYWVSVSNFDQLWKVDRASRELLYKVGGEDSDFALQDGDTQLSARQHQFQVLEDGILIHDNGSAEAGGYSRAVEYSLDYETGLATEVWSYRRDPDLYVLGYGDIKRLDDDSTLVAWGSGGVMQGLNSQSETLWEFSALLGGAFGYNSVLPSLYPED